MNTSDGVEFASAVEDILEAARARAPPTGDSSIGGSSTVDPSTGGSVDVDARSLADAFAAAESDGRVPVIAEVKPTSPTTDGTRDDDPVALAREMVAGGAAALSVLTEPEYFGGSTDALERVRDAVSVPVLRKDFLLTERELDRVESDVVLLIARFLRSEDADDLETMLQAARDRGFQALVEVHTEAELERALDAGATLVGVNNRDLAKLDVDLGTFERVASEVPASAREDVTLVAESGVTTTDDVARMRRADADALLVGSAIMDGAVRANTERLTSADATAPDAIQGDTTETTER